MFSSVTLVTPTAYVTIQRILQQRKDRFMNKHPHKTENPLLKECLFTALIKLMDQKDFKDIKISEIAQKAGVSRMTYYRTYDSKEDILIQYFEDQSRQMLHSVSENPDLTIYDAFRLFFSFFKDQAYLVEYLYKAGLLKEVIQRFTTFVSESYDKAEERMLDQAYKVYEVNFVSGGLFLLLLSWIERGLTETPEEMARITMQLLHISSSEPT